MSFRMWRLTVFSLFSDNTFLVWTDSSSENFAGWNPFGNRTHVRLGTESAAVNAGHLDHSATQPSSLRVMGSIPPDGFQPAKFSELELVQTKKVLSENKIMCRIYYQARFQLIN